MKKLILLFLLFCMSNSLQAEVEFTITKSSDSAITIAVLPFINNNEYIKIAKVISNDLILSGQFKALAPEQLIERPNNAQEIKYSTWRLLGVDYLTIGQINKTGEERYEIFIKLFSVVDEIQIMSLTLPVREGELRSGGHYFADKIYEEITGIKGVFSTKIAYITATQISGSIEYQLLVADADGKGSQALVTSKQPLLSPSWSPRGDKLAYVSFEKGNSAIYIQNLATGSRQLMSSFKGINSAPAFSPDGSKLAMTLSKSGNPEIYIMNIYTKELIQITNSWAIDTEPSWAPNGKSLVFTSGRGGKPNLYRVNLDDLKITRLTFAGDYNAGSDFSSNNEYIGYVQGIKNNYKINLMHNKSATSQAISEGPLDENPTFAPNNHMVLYASKNAEGQGILISTSLDGAVKNQLVISNGHIKDPAWSPIIN